MPIQISAACLPIVIALFFLFPLPATAVEKGTPVDCELKQGEDVRTCLYTAYKQGNAEAAFRFARLAAKHHVYNPPESQAQYVSRMNKIIGALKFTIQNKARNAEEAPLLLLRTYGAAIGVLGSGFYDVSYFENSPRNEEGSRAIIAEGERFIRRAASQDISYAQYQLGKLYEKGALDDGGPDQAVIWYKRAVQAGHTGAEKALNKLCLTRDDC